MPVTIRKTGTKGKGKELKPIEFTNEVGDLQEVLFFNPNLLKNVSDLELKSVCNPLALDIGSVDLFLIDSEGLPVAVEVKLKSNAESHRQVIGQLLDYISSLSRLNFERINKDTGGNLQEVALSFLPDQDPSDRQEMLKEFRTKFDSNLNTGRIRGIIAIDSAPLDLLKTFRHLNDQTSRDYRLVTIQRNLLSSYDSHGREVEYEVFSSSFPILNEYIDPSQIRPFFKLVIQEFEELKPTGMIAYPSYSKGKIENFRVKSEHLPDSVYYEFSDWKDSVSIEIQLFNSEISTAYDLVKNLEDPLSSNLRSIKHEWRCVNGKRFCRLMFYYSNETPPYIIAEQMCQLIEETHKILMEVSQITSSE